MYPNRTRRELYVSLWLHVFVFFYILPSILGSAIRESLYKLNVNSFFDTFTEPIELMRTLATNVPGAFDTFFAGYLLLLGGSWYIFFQLRFGPAWLFPLGWIFKGHKAYGFTAASYDSFSEGPPLLYGRYSLEMTIVITFALTNPVAMLIFLYSCGLR